MAQIITFGTMAAKAAIKDVGRAMDMPYADVDRIAKMVPTTLEYHASSRRSKIRRRLQQAYENETQIRQLIDTAKKLEGLVRNAGVHAAGVVISPRPLTDLVPLHKTKNDEIVTAYDMGAIEKTGPAEDGLPRAHHAHHSRRHGEADRADQRRAASGWKSCRWTIRRRIRRSSTPDLRPASSSLNRTACATFCGATSPDSIEDLTALNALYRPGPIQGGMIDDFIDRKHGRKKHRIRTAGAERRFCRKRWASSSTRNR